MPDQMIKKLIELDKFARQKVESAQKEKDELEDFLKIARRTLLKEETAKTQAAIREALEQGERDKVAKAAELKDDFETTLKDIEARYAEHRDEWVEALFKACLE